MFPREVPLVGAGPCILPWGADVQRATCDGRRWGEACQSKSAIGDVASDFQPWIARYRAFCMRDARSWRVPAAPSKLSICRMQVGAIGSLLPLRGVVDLTEHYLVSAAEARGVLEGAEHSAPRRARLMGSGRHHAAALDTRSRPGKRSTTTTWTRTRPRTRAQPAQRLIASFASTGRARVTEFVMQSTQATNQLNPTGVGTRRCARVRLVRGTDTDGPQAPCCCRLQVIDFEIGFRAQICPSRTSEAGWTPRSPTRTCIL